MRSAILFALGVGLLGTASTLLAMGRKPSPTSKFSGWMVYWDIENSEKTFQKLGPSLEEISLFAYAFDPQGSLIPSTETVPDMQQWLFQERLRSKPRLLLTIVNDVRDGKNTTVKDPSCVHQAIANAPARAAHI